MNEDPLDYEARRKRLERRRWIRRLGIAAAVLAAVAAVAAPTHLVTASHERGVASRERVAAERAVVAERCSDAAWMEYQYAKGSMNQALAPLQADVPLAARVCAAMENGGALFCNHDAAYEAMYAHLPGRRREDTENLAYSALRFVQSGRTSFNWNPSVTEDVPAGRILCD